jgi:hypothetical protein
MIPLMMEKNYTPSGWLGLIMGSVCDGVCFWLEFSYETRS